MKTSIRPRLRRAFAPLPALRSALVLLVLGGVAAAAEAQSDSATAGTPATVAPSSASAGATAAKVTYATQSLVYIDAGSRDGIEAGDVVEVVRGSAVVARLEVVEVSSGKAACRRLDGGAAVAVGDGVRFDAPSGDDAATPSAAAGGDDAGHAQAKAKTKDTRDIPTRLRDLGLSGRVGVRYNMVRESDSGFGYDQPGLDLRLRGHDIAGSRVDTDVDVRAYRSYRDLDGDSSTRASTRVYRANASWTSGSIPLRVALGRQFSPSLANLSIFDGGLAEYDTRRVSFGVLAGTQPDDDYGLSSKIQQYGTWAEVHSLAGEEARWAGTLGLVGSYEGSTVNREFFYLQGRYDRRRGGLYVAQEVDINRSWKKDQGESTLSATSTNAHGRFRVTDALTLSAGVDNRRDVRLYRDYVSPETDFDDDYRSGWWMRADTRFGLLRSGFDVRFSRGGDNGDANAYTLHLGAGPLTPLRFDLRSRTTRFDADGGDGWLQSFTARAPIGERVGAALQGGLRDETGAGAGSQDTSVGWYGVDLDVTLWQRWLYIVSVERTDGDGVASTQLYMGLSWRF